MYVNTFNENFFILIFKHNIFLLIDSIDFKFDTKITINVYINTINILHLIITFLLLLKLMVNGTIMSQLGKNLVNLNFSYKNISLIFSDSYL